jgi:hypothetical protein
METQSSTTQQRPSMQFSESHVYDAIETAENLFTQVPALLKVYSSIVTHIEDQLNPIGKLMMDMNEKIFLGTWQLLKALTYSGLLMEKQPKNSKVKKSDNKRNPPSNK